jgi:hypothetical protein
MYKQRKRTTCTAELWTCHPALFVPGQQSFHFRALVFAQEQQRYDEEQY